MKKSRMIAYAALACTLAIGGGIAAVNFAGADSAPVLEGLKMLDGMSIRMGEPQGLRFTAKLDMTDAQYEESGIVEMGTVLMPEAGVTGELTVDETSGTATALTIKTEKWIDEEDENSRSYNSVLVNTGETGAFPEAFYNTPISARAYAKYADGSYKYSENTVTRSISYVAKFFQVSELNGYNNPLITTLAAAADENSSLTLNGGEALSVGNTDGYQASFKVGGMEVVATDEIEVDWSKEGDAITVDKNGLVSVVQKGTATLKATATVNGNTLEKTVSVTVNAPTKQVNEKYFVIRQTNDNGETVVNDFAYELASTEVESVTLAGNELDTSLYAVEGNAISVHGEAFVGLDKSDYFEVPQTLVIETAGETVEATFGSIITFAITKASDVHTGNASKAAPFMAAGGLADGGRSASQGAWGGNFILMNDIDFDFATIAHNAPCYNYGIAGNAGFAGIFDGQGYTFKNFRLAGDNNSFFGQIIGGSVIKNTKFIGFRTSGSALYHSNLGLFDCCYGTVENIYVDGVADDTSPVLGYFASGSRLVNSTIYVGGGDAAYSSTTSVFIVLGSADMTGTTIYTPYGTPETNATVEKWSGSYHALKVDAEDGTLEDNPFVKEVKGTSLVSVKMLTSSGAVDMTSLSTFADGKVTVDVEDKGVYAGSGNQNTYLGRGRIIQIKTNEETLSYTQDLVTYAIDDISDMQKGTASKARFLQVMESATRSYVALANDILCETPTVAQTGGDCFNRTGSYDVLLQYSTFDGRGYTVDNMKLYADATTWSSFFGSVNGTVMKDVSFTNITQCGGYSYGFFGGNSAAIMKNVFVEGTAGVGPSEADIAVVGAFRQGSDISDCTFVVRAPEGETNLSMEKAIKSYDSVAKSFTTVKLYTDYAVSSLFTFGTKGSIDEWNALQQ